MCEPENLGGRGGKKANVFVLGVWMEYACLMLTAKMLFNVWQCEHKQKVTVYLFIEPQELILGDGLSRKREREGEKRGTGQKRKRYWFKWQKRENWEHELMARVGFRKIWCVCVCALLSTLSSLVLVKQRINGKRAKWNILRNDHSCVSYAVMVSIVSLEKKIHFFFVPSFVYFVHSVGLP